MRKDRKEKRKLMIYIHDLLDSCSVCEKHQYRVGDDYDKFCAGCKVYEEFIRLRPALLGEQKQPKKEVTSVALEMTVDEFIRLHYLEGKSLKEIAELKGVPRQSIYNFRYRWKEQIEKMLEEKGIVKEEKQAESVAIEPSPKKDEEPTSVPVSDSEKELVEKELAEVKESFVKLREENRELRNYVAALRAQLDELAVNGDVEQLRKENQILRELVRMWA